jgi:hypothetical protein
LVWWNVWSAIEPKSTTTGATYFMEYPPLLIKVN